MDNNTTIIKQLKQKIDRYQKQQKVWKHQKQMLTKNINLMQQQIIKYKIINTNLLKKTNHKRSCSDQQTFIFNQTNISSYYPIVMINKGYNWIPKANLRSHLDSIRVVYWQNGYLITAGQDCLLKIWQKDKLKITVRQHLAPIFTICGDNQYLFTAGAQGVIRQWSINNFLINGNTPICQGEFHQDSIWEMIWNRNFRILVTSSSDNKIKIIKEQNGKLNQGYEINTGPDIPTSVAFVGNQKFVSGFIQNKKLFMYEIQKGKKVNQFCYQSKQMEAQVNKVIYLGKNKVVISGHQDRMIRFFDPNSGKLIKSIVAHSDSVTSLCSRNSQSAQLISCSHDSTLRVWDIRRFKCVNDIGIHMKKYDESLLCLAYNSEEQLVAVGGADGQIKILGLEN